MGYERFYSLLNRLPGRSDDTKDDLIERFTGGRTTSLRQMTEQEYRAMCEALEEETGRPLRKRRSSVLRLMQQIGSRYHQLDTCECFLPRQENSRETVRRTRLRGTGGSCGETTRHSPQRRTEKRSKKDIVSCSIDQT